MDSFQVEPALLVKDTPKPRRIHTLSEARSYLREALHQGRPPPWRDLLQRLDSVCNEEEAIEAIGAMRELLDLEGLLLPPEVPLETGPSH